MEIVVYSYIIRCNDICYNDIFCEYNDIIICIMICTKELMTSIITRVRKVRNQQQQL